jgi:hypothetical protein
MLSRLVYDFLSEEFASPSQPACQRALSTVVDLVIDELRCSSFPADPSFVFSITLEDAMALLRTHITDMSFSEFMGILTEFILSMRAKSLPTISHYVSELKTIIDRYFTKGLYQTLFSVVALCAVFLSRDADTDPTSLLIRKGEPCYPQPTW